MDHRRGQGTYKETPYCHLDHCATLCAIAFVENWTTGRKILNEHIALAVLGTYGAIAVSQMGGSKEAKAAAGSPDAKANDPPINASSS